MLAVYVGSLVVVLTVSLAFQPCAGDADEAFPRPARPGGHLPPDRRHLHAAAGSATGALGDIMLAAVWGAVAMSGSPSS